MMHYQIARWIMAAPRSVRLHARLRANTGWSIPVYIDGGASVPPSTFTLTATRYRGARNFTLDHDLKWLSWPVAQVDVSSIRLKTRAPCTIPFQSLPPGTTCARFKMPADRLTYLGEGVWEDKNGNKLFFQPNGRYVSWRNRRAPGDLAYETISFTSVPPPPITERPFDFNEWSTWFYKHSIKEGER